jgi:two-component system, chemotaxis family, sensor kinase CheA
VLGTEPAALGEDFAGEFRLFVAGKATAAGVAEAIRGGGEVAEVTVVEAGSAGAAVVAATAAARAPGQAAAQESTAQESHVRVELERIDVLSAGVAELSILEARLEALAARLGRPDLVALAEPLHRLTRELRESTLALRLAPVREVFDRLPRLVRDAARALGREVELRVEGGEIQLDRAVAHEVTDPLVHLVRNAIDHGIEAPAAREQAGKPRRGSLTVRGERRRGAVALVIEDDGAGISREQVCARARELGVEAPAPEALDDAGLLRLLGHPGLSTAERVTAVSGRGVGLDVVLERIRRLGGAVELTTRHGAGTRFTLIVPVTAALAESLRVRVGAEEYVLPLTLVTETVALTPAVITAAPGGELLRLREQELPLLRLAHVLGSEDGAAGSETTAIVAEAGERRAAFAVHEVVKREQVIVRRVDAPAETLPYFSGAVLLADGRPALVLDPMSLLQIG